MGLAPGPAEDLGRAPPPQQLDDDAAAAARQERRQQLEAALAAGDVDVWGGVNLEEVGRLRVQGPGLWLPRPQGLLFPGPHRAVQGSGARAGGAGLLPVGPAARPPGGRRWQGALLSHAPRGLPGLHACALSLRPRAV
jgi:hypothetical protein